LVIGFGNTLRGDDGVGPHVAGIVASWELPGLRSMVATQLTPELAEPVAAAERVVFVDARLDTGRGTIKVAPVGLSNSQAMSGHFCDPRFLLSLARSVYGSDPQAWLITIPTADFSLRESLSPLAKRGVEAALARIRAMLNVDVTVDPRLDEVDAEGLSDRV
jgi:hydrogenase maturation protease